MSSKPISITIGLWAEGKTDERFLSPIIKRVLQDIINEDRERVQAIEVDELQIFPLSSDIKDRKKFRDKALNILETAKKNNLTLVCIHTDADAPTDKKAYKEKIKPTIEHTQQQDKFIEYIVPIIPIQTIESWLLADKNCLFKQIGYTDLTPELNSNPEKIRKPKERIKKLISETLKNAPRRRRQCQLNIGDIYGPLGNEIALEELRRLSSFDKFERHLKQVYHKIIDNHTSL